MRLDRPIPRFVVGFLPGTRVPGTDFRPRSSPACAKGALERRGGRPGAA